MSENERPESDDERVSEEEAAAAQEAGAIGGRGGAPEDVDEAERPLAESGQGYAEGFEQAEQELVEQATHDDPGVDPTQAAGEPEAERSDAEYGEPDHVESSERVDDE